MAYFPTWISHLVKHRAVRLANADDNSYYDSFKKIEVTTCLVLIVGNVHIPVKCVQVRKMSLMMVSNKVCSYPEGLFLVLPWLCQDIVEKYCVSCTQVIQYNTRSRNNKNYPPNKQKMLTCFRHNTCGQK